jgi:hypothetical protein
MLHIWVKYSLYGNYTTTVAHLYLGLPLSLKSLKKSDLLLQLEKIARKLATWKSLLNDGKSRLA